MTLSTAVEISYLFSSVLFVIGLKRLQSPATARRGNQLAALAMFIAICATLLGNQIAEWNTILIGIAVGGIIGYWAAKTVQMTEMPELVGIFNGFGGAASALVAGAELLRLQSLNVTSPLGEGLSIVLSCLIGTVTFSGSFVAFGKLKGIVSGNPITFPLQKTLNAGLFIGLLVLGGAIMGLFQLGDLTTLNTFYIFTIAALSLGILLVIPIGGADMPVVISLLNSYSGLAASAAGFVISSNVLIISGALVGASGLILTLIMCKAMNRSLTNVAFGAFGGESIIGTQGDGSEKIARPVDAEGAAMILAYAQSVVVVPGYGLAVAQAQHELRKVVDNLEEKGVDVKYAIHPVAGRMPGHMNVLLAEADVSYDKLFDLDEINDDFDRTDVVLVVGANDVVNPEAHNPQSVIAGMPILDVDKAKSVIVMKRSLSTGFAGIDNPLFYMDHTLMLFGDAKETMNDLVREVREA